MNQFFIDKVSWTSTTNEGTGYAYDVYQQKIDWDLKVKGKTNLQRAMMEGKPAHLNLHHSRQDARGALFEISNITHRARSGKGKEALHPYGNKQYPDYPVNRKAFDADRKQYWEDRAKQELAHRNTKCGGRS
ncbi:HNH/ENDO VII family nuclease [Photorhabdus luminescens]|uniref:HNH/ENDO VII family nuclease n=1 Tax=Photorhabdus luminescens TaxID=29488 RepID=UPI001C3C57B3|nr:HNH/ENDO VII family nuclease [Photorhabdus luminescens]